MTFAHRVVETILRTASETISQTITTTPGQTYIVNWHYSDDVPFPPSPGPDTSTGFTFKIDGNQVYSNIDEAPIPVVPFSYIYTLKTFAFQATSSSTVLEFDIYNSPGYYYLDDVSVVPLPVPCDPTFYEFDPSTGDLQIEPGKVYPGPPQPDTTFPQISSDGVLEFNYQSVSPSSTFPRVITLGFAPPSTQQNFDGTSATCQFQRTQATGCPTGADSDITFPFSVDG